MSAALPSCTMRGETIEDAGIGRRNFVAGTRNWRRRVRWVACRG